MIATAPAVAPAVPTQPGFREALRFWAKLGCINFGGPAGQIAIMNSELVDRRGWIDQASFLRGLNFATLLPGPEAQQLACYIGWRLHGTKGAIAAGSLFVIPGALVMLALSWVAARYNAYAPVAAVFHGLKPVVVAVIGYAVWRIGRRTLTAWPAVALAVAAFLGIAVAGIDFPWIVLGAAVIGFIAGRAGLPAFAGRPHGPETVPVGHAASGARRDWPRLLILLAVFAGLWVAPVAAIVAIWGVHPFRDVAELFTKAAFITFGGAYAVLPYVADAAVNTYGWLAAHEMVNGLALAETTPGPLILVLQYVGFYAGWNNTAGLDPLQAAILASALTTYVTFLPSFLFILACSPYIERLHAVPALGSALAAISAAVVGVILNLGVFLGRAALLPEAGIDWAAVALAVIALGALIRWSIEIHWLVLAGAGAGLAHAAWTGAL